MSTVAEGDGEEQTISESFPDQNSIESIEKQIKIRELVSNEGCFDSPINISLTYSTPMTLSPLKWVNFEVPPKKMKLTNTGHTVIFSAKWGQERPYIMDGPFVGRYVFSSWHLHWGISPLEGSEHAVDGVKYPAEMHVILFKSSYLTQEAALKEQDGCAALVYFFKLQDTPNPCFQDIIMTLKDIHDPGTSRKISPSPITSIVRKFTNDYFLYWGAISTARCRHYLMWLINRVPIGVSEAQIDAFRYLTDEEGHHITRNFRELQDTKDRTVLHINPSTSRYATLLSIPEDNNYFTY
ncbi:unnamed protein product [Acanthoscelides obtectus]|uniref:Carbonic anhydrase n=1 Tax=Acanthoscelides obtectus TaxID=200917 RepID=A0A9P0PRE1_ACAOB|nr:unnamed protein product [Acanthoscelides obtectus]CAK1652555.1 Carbonic anhydrase 2 [Acanthoscelides obtectus]